MITKTFYQCKAIQSNDALQFQNEVNQVLADLAETNASDVVLKENLVDGFKVLITYKQTKRIPETVADEYHLQGISFTCFNCPLHETVTDGRTKHANCMYHEYGRTRLDSDACNYFYKMLKLEKIKPVYCD